MSDGRPPLSAALPPGMLFRVFAPVATIALLLAVLVATPEGGPVGGGYGAYLLLGAALFAAFALRWFLRAPRPRGALDWFAAGLPVLLAALLIVLRVVAPGR